jgi:hypothetical protein
MALLHAKGQDQDLEQQQRGHVLRVSATLVSALFVAPGAD